MEPVSSSFSLIGYLTNIRTFTIYMIGKCVQTYFFYISINFDTRSHIFIYVGLGFQCISGWVSMCYVPVCMSSLYLESLFKCLFYGNVSMKITFPLCFNRFSDYSALSEMFYIFSSILTRYWLEILLQWCLSTIIPIPRSDSLQLNNGCYTFFFLSHKHMQYVNKSAKLIRTHNGKKQYAYKKHTHSHTYVCVCVCFLCINFV